MTEHEASRTLVKSAPELWAECSDASSLARHLDQFGEIKITRLEPETAVAWEGELASGTVKLEPSGWGTRVTLTALPAAPLAPVESPPPDPPAPVDSPPPDPPPLRVVPAQPAAPPPDPEPLLPAAVSEPEPERPQPAAPSAPAWAAPPTRGGFMTRLMSLFATRPASSVVPAPEPEPAAVAAPEPEPEPEPAAVAAPEPEPEPEPAAIAEPEPAAVAAPEPELPPVPDALEALSAALDSLGQAHHRPFSRA
jgi:hypothetical protein